MLIEGCLAKKDDGIKASVPTTPEAELLNQRNNVLRHELPR
jgi:hypothetical protein